MCCGLTFRIYFKTKIYRLLVSKSLVEDHIIRKCMYLLYIRSSLKKSRFCKLVFTLVFPFSYILGLKQDVQEGGGPPNVILKNCTGGFVPIPYFQL